LLGAPLLGIRWGFPDGRVLPGSFSARQLGDELRSEFRVNSQTDVFVVMPDVTGVPDASWTAMPPIYPGHPIWCPCRHRRAHSYTAASPGRPWPQQDRRMGSAFFTISTNVPLCPA
jgi:putative drug exporter of the RND superfamily